MKPGGTGLAKMETQAEIMELISKGKTRKEIVDYLGSLGVKSRNCYVLYHNALKEMTPEDDYLDAEKKYLIQQNLDRLETIINSSISGNTGDKKVALQAIDTLNKMIGVYSDSNKVTIAKNNQGEEIIQIDFNK
jgi:hypothetical protein